MDSLDPLDPAGDVDLFWRLRRLAAKELPHPLVTLRGEGSSFRDFDVELTGTGRDVLEGRANRVEVNGVDEWIGGVHLDSSASRAWWNVGGELVERPEP